MDKRYCADIRWDLFIMLENQFFAKRHKLRLEPDLKWIWEFWILSKKLSTVEPHNSPLRRGIYKELEEGGYYRVFFINHSSNRGGCYREKGGAVIRFDCTNIRQVLPLPG